MIPLGVICYGFGLNFLRLPDRGGKSRNLSSVLIKRFKNSGSQEEDMPVFRSSNRKGGPEAARVAAITSKLKNGNRLFNTANLGKLQDKHPLQHMGARIPPTPDNMPALQVSEDSVLKAI